jgi:DNA-binding NtrC family response regulator
MASQIGDAMTLPIGASSAHIRLLETLDKVAPTDVEVLIFGPTGTGKQLYANYIHQHSHRSNCAFVPVNCASLPADLIENELFGHVGGAFTGAKPETRGLVAAAEGGTLLLDELDSLPLFCQGKLLRFLQEKEYRRLGDTRLRSANVRIIAATNADLVAAVRAKTFREDLFFRLRVVPVTVPSLAERKEDIAPLVTEFVNRWSQVYRLPKVVFTTPAMERLQSYSWPGNIRELENCIKYLTCLQLTRSVDPYDLPLLEEKAGTDAPAPALDVLVDAGPLKAVKRELIDRFERAYLESALRAARGNITAAARTSGKARRVFFELMRKHGLAANAPTVVPRANTPS